ARRVVVVNRTEIERQSHHSRNRFRRYPGDRDCREFEARGHLPPIREPFLVVGALPTSASPSTLPTGRSQGGPAPTFGWWLPPLTVGRIQTQIGEHVRTEDLRIPGR